MSISHVASNTATASSGTTITLSKPTGAAAGNLLIALFYVQCDTQPTITPPAGWTSRGTTTGTQTRAQVFTKIAGDSEPASYDFTSSLTIVVGSGAISAYASTLSIVIGDYLFDATTTNPGVAPTVTTTINNAMLFCAFFAIALGSAVTGMTSRVALNNGVRDIASFDQTIANAGATGTRTYTGSGSSWTFSLAIEEIALQNRIRMMI